MINPEGTPIRKQFSAIEVSGIPVAQQTQEKVNLGLPLDIASICRTSAVVRGRIVLFFDDPGFLITSGLDERQRQLGFIPWNPNLSVISLGAMGVSHDPFLNRIASFFPKLPPDLYLHRQQQMDYLILHRPDQKNLLEAHCRAYYLGEQNLLDILALIPPLTASEQKDFDAIQPNRFRSASRHRLIRSIGEGWHIQDLPLGSFTQTVGEMGVIKRKFSETDPVISRDEDFRILMRGIADRVETCERFLPEGTREVQSLLLTAHLMGISAKQQKSATNSPTGKHKDECDYILSALVVKRSQNLQGGESIVYDSDGKTPRFRVTLQEGQGIFMRDDWHDVTPISGEGYRWIIGMDVQVETNWKDHLKTAMHTLKRKIFTRQCDPSVFYIPEQSLQSAVSHT